jgi:hypothetical protein
MNFDSAPAPVNTVKAISAEQAVRRGTLVVNGPVLMLLVVPVLVAALVFKSNVGAFAAFGVGFVLAWLWWSLSVPRWRDWALSRGADPERLQTLGVRAGILWPKGWIFEKTELPPKKG